MYWILIGSLVLNIYLLWKAIKNYFVASAIIYHYTEIKKQPNPSNSEIKNATEWVIERVFEDLFRFKKKRNH